MRFGSVCSGIEAASVAWNPLGLEAAWVAEIEPFPCAVLAHHYPDVPNLGDMLDSVVVAGDVMVAIPSVTERIQIGEFDAPEILCGGTPCQAFSVAGLRKSLEDDRGNLTLTFCEIADAIDTARDVSGREPCIVFWENVPGVLNTPDNAFGCFLGKLAGEDCPLVPTGEGWSNAGCVIGPRRTIAWRILDAQYFGLAQRRKRVFVVASARIGFDPVEILFIEDGLRRDTPPSREAGQGSAVSPSLRAQANCSHRLDSQAYIADAVAHSLRGEGFDASEDGTGRGTPLVCVHGTQDPCIDENVAFALGRNNGGENVIGFVQNQRDEVRITEVSGALAAEPGMKQQTYVAFSCKDHGQDASDIALTLRSMGHDGSHANGGGQVAVAFQTIPIDMRQASRGAKMTNNRAEGSSGGPPGTGIGESGDPSPTIGTTHVPAVAFNMHKSAHEASSLGITEDRTDCLRAFDKSPFAVQPSGSMQVRRLTPRECERLQGFPDNYTRIPYRKKPPDECPDGPRYKALGNSWAVPVVRWIGQRILKCLATNP